MKNIKLILFTLFTALLFNSCELNDESEISGHDITQSPTIYGWRDASATEAYFADQGTIDKEYFIKLLGGGIGNTFNQDITYTIRVVEDETTATGEYTILSNSGTLSAGEEFTTFKVGINTGAFSRTTPTKVTFEIVPSTIDGVVLSALAKKMELNFVGCASSLEGSYTSNGNTRNLTKFDEVFYRFPYLSPISVDFWFEFKDICGDITITNWQLEGSYHLEQNAPGYVDENGNIVFPSLTLEGVSWYVNKEVILTKN